MVRKTLEELPKLTPEQIEELNRLAARPDSEIDFSDIPEITEIPPGAIRRKDWKHYGGRTIELSGPVHAHFAAIASRRAVSLNTVINEVLDKVIELEAVAK
jgi:predicted HicB family RNase H-like nuclease